MLPPSERETYQTHIPCRSKALLLTLAAGSTCPAPPVSAGAEVASAVAASKTRMLAAHAASAVRSAGAPSFLRVG
jgi:hypothetical protein